VPTLSLGAIGKMNELYEKRVGAWTGSSNTINACRL
jgi:hypothetical protein